MYSCIEISYRKQRFANLNEIENEPVKLHFIERCKCSRIKNRIPAYLINKNIKIIIEKRTNKKNNSMMLVFHNDDLEHNESVNETDMILCQIYHKQIEMRKQILEYFRNYIWSQTESIQIRSSIYQLTSVSYCNDSIENHDLMYNSGIVIIGNQEQMESISNIFNEYVKKTEFVKLFPIKLEELALMDSKNINFNIRLLIENEQFQQLDQQTYTLIGLTDDKRKPENIGKYSFSFGKREWFSSTLESSLECARRELYEEFNMQYSNEISDYSSSLNLPYQIVDNTRLLKLFLLHLPSTISIEHHLASDTICLN